MFLYHCGPYNDPSARYHKELEDSKVLHLPPLHEKKINNMVSEGGGQREFN